MEVFRINPNVLVDGRSVEHYTPKKCVKSADDISAWQISKAYYDLIGFINGISIHIQGKLLTSEMHVSETMHNLMEIFDKLNIFIDETPPLDQQHRFGNKAYRIWSRRANEELFLMLQKALPVEKCNTVSELGTYLAESFGNPTRIDYGTGHELSFLFFLCGLFKAEILVEEDSVACALKLFDKYLKLARRLQTTYRMEPAGSQGVWSLDDYQFIPFMWGSAQLAHSAPFEPPQFLDEEIINKYKDQYMFMGCIDYISKVKTGHFAEHSNQLWSITAVSTWPKIYMGLLRMYPKEILSKYPIIQHVYFGKLMSFERVKPGTVLKAPQLGFIKPTSQNPTKSTSTDPNDMQSKSNVKEHVSIFKQPEEATEIIAAVEPIESETDSSKTE